MNAHHTRHAHHARAILAALALSMPLIAAAQFSVVSQTGSGSARVNEDALVLNNASTTSLDSHSWSASAGTKDHSTASGGGRTFIEPGMVGISAGAGATAVPYNYYYNICANGNYSSSYGSCNGGAAMPGFASGAGAVKLTFDVTTGTDVLVTGTDLYRGASHGGFSSSLSLSRVDANDSLIAVAARPDIYNITHLDAGRYVLSADFSYYLTSPSGLAGGGASVNITAVPEPGSVSMLTLGMLGLAAVVRRRRAGAQA